MAAKGLEVLKGTFTIQDNTGYTIKFGKTFTKYFYFVEMTDESKTAFASSGISNTKAYSIAGIYPMPEISNKRPSNFGVASRYTPSTDEVGAATFAVNNVSTDGSQIKFPTASATGGGASNLYIEYSYNYIVVSLDNA